MVHDILILVASKIIGVFGWKEMEGKEGERFRGAWIPCLDSKMGAKKFEGKRIRRIWYLLFIKVPISLKLERFKEKALISLPFPFIPSYTNKSYFLSISLLFSSFPFFPSPTLPFFSFQNCYQNIILRYSWVKGSSRGVQGVRPPRAPKIKGPKILTDSTFSCKLM